MISLQSSPMNETLHSLPKIELHRHLEGSWRLDTLRDVAFDFCLPIDNYELETLRPFVQIMPDEPHTMERFLGKFRYLRQFFRSETVIKRVAYEAVADAAADNVRYMELRFTPQALNNILHCSYLSVVQWMCEATQQAAADHGIQVRLIVSMNRHEAVSIGEEVLEAALYCRAKGVVAIDLAGQETGFPCLPFQAIFQRAKAEGLFVTVHAGEWAGAESVRDAVELLGADRIGHGIRVLEDPALVETLSQRGTTFEVCPTSNYHSGIVTALRDHPLPAMRDSGLRTTINTDDPLISNISLTDQLAHAVEHLGYSLAQIKAAQIAAAQAVFLPPADRDVLVSQFETWMA
ncbi:MAG: adenosine deaminase [bacterium]|nr:adenosine deaminase [bacterium]